MVFTTEQISEIKAKSVAATEQLRSEFVSIEEYNKQQKEKLEVFNATLEDKSGPKEELVAKAIAKIPVCNDGKEAIANLVTIITDMVIDMPKVMNPPAERPFIPFSMMVPTKNKNSHDYLIDGPSMMLGDCSGSGDRGFRYDGRTGNHLQWEESGMRPATDDEIDKFFKVWKVLSESGAPLGVGYELLDTEIKVKEEEEEKGKPGSSSSS